MYGGMHDGWDHKWETGVLFVYPISNVSIRKFLVGFLEGDVYTVPRSVGPRRLRIGRLQLQLSKVILSFQTLWDSSSHFLIGNVILVKK